MAKGYFIRIGDKTTCGGTVLAGDPRHNLKGMSHNRIYGIYSAGARGSCPFNSGLLTSLPELTYWLEETKPVKSTPEAIPAVVAEPLTNRNFWIRWVSILSICIAYYFIVFYFNLVLAVNYSETMSQGGGFTSSQYEWFIHELLYQHNNSALASTIGFAVCIPLILLIFKKVR